MKYFIKAKMKYMYFEMEMKQPVKADGNYKNKKHDVLCNMTF